MNGANAEPSDNTIKKPRSTRKIIIGVNHHFLRFFKKSKNSLIIISFDKSYSSLLLILDNISIAIASCPIELSEVNKKHIDDSFIPIPRDRNNILNSLILKLFFIFVFYVLIDLFSIYPIRIYIFIQFDVNKFFPK